MVWYARCGRRTRQARFDSGGAEAVPDRAVPWPRPCLIDVLLKFGSMGSRQPAFITTFQGCLRPRLALRRAQAFGANQACLCHHGHPGLRALNLKRHLTIFELELEGLGDRVLFRQCWSAG